MPTTPTLALPYPGPSQTPDGPLAFQQLAEAVEAVLVDLRQPPQARYRATATKALPASAWTKAPLDDVADALNASTLTPAYAADTVTLGQAGTYLLVATFTSTTRSDFALRLLVGANVYGQTAIPPNGVSLSNSTSALVRVAAGAVVSAEAYSPTAQTLAADAATSPASLYVARLSR